MRRKIAQAAKEKAEQVVAKLKEMKLAKAAEIVVTGIEETLYYFSFPPRALAESAHEQPARAAAARDATKHPRGGGVSRRQAAPDAGCGATASRRRHPVGHATLSRHEPPRRSERSSMITRAKTFGSPSGEPSTTRPYASTNVRKTLDATPTFPCLEKYCTQITPVPRHLKQHKN